MTVGRCGARYDNGGGTGSRFIAAALLSVVVCLPTTACSQPESEPAPPLPSPAIAQAEQLLEGVAEPKLTGDEVFSSAEDADIIHGFTRESARLVAGEDRLAAADCAPVASALGLAAPPDDLFAAAGRVKDETLTTLLLHARTEVGQLLTACAGGTPVQARQVQSARLAIALVQTRLTTLGVAS
ncbi:hypothetical protein [Gephyromycinifex aptenodytis]|uniref:hypothetical protein n=1 Tax=Gephyromycinifex aptenodytis TaxID=2716227 RepID=UPI001446D8B2|nr:hypothetical protein [Gephyromycinifex aptenodytis]